MCDVIRARETTGKLSYSLFLCVSFCETSHKHRYRYIFEDRTRRVVVSFLTKLMLYVISLSLSCKQDLFERIH